MYPTELLRAMMPSHRYFIFACLLCLAFGCDKDTPAKVSKENGLGIHTMTPKEGCDYRINGTILCYPRGFQNLPLFTLSVYLNRSDWVETVYLETKRISRPPFYDVCNGSLYYFYDLEKKEASLKNFTAIKYMITNYPTKNYVPCCKAKQGERCLYNDYRYIAESHPMNVHSVYNNFYVTKDAEYFWLNDGSSKVCLGPTSVFDTMAIGGKNGDTDANGDFKLGKYSGSGQGLHSSSGPPPPAPSNTELPESSEKQTTSSMSTPLNNGHLHAVMAVFLFRCLIAW